MNTDTVANQTAQENQAADIPTEAGSRPGILIDHIDYLLTEAGVVDTASWKLLLDQEAFESPNIHVQRFKINRAWVAILTSLPTMDQVLQTRNARGCLMGVQCSLEDYSRLFQTEVIPCAIRMGLLISTKVDSTITNTESPSAAAEDSTT